MKKIIITATAAIALFCIASSSDKKDEGQSATMGGVPSESTRDAFVTASESTVNGVVSIKSFATPRQSMQAMDIDPLLEFFYGMPGRSQRRQQQEPQQQQMGLGSGVIISDDGYIVTNNHVIADAERLEVTLNDNRNFDATVVGTDPVTDLALIKIDAPSLHVIPMGKSEDLHVGEWVLAVGNPFGFTSTVTSGIVSAKARNIYTTTGTPTGGGIESYIQTDAAVNRGNSGGALVNLKGELVGINTAIYSQTGTYAGCSFAIPTSIVEKVVADIKKYGTVQRAVLGISFIELSPELIAKEKLQGPTAGIYVAEVLDRSAALEAGLQKGDIIVAIDGKPIRSTAEMQEAMTRMSPGDKVDIQYYRDGTPAVTSATMRNKSGNTSITRADNDSRLGATFKPIDRETSRRLGIRAGLEVSALQNNGFMSRAGIREGFIIVSVNGQRVSKPEDMTAAYKQATAEGSDRVLFISGIYPSGKTAHYAVPLDE